MAQQIHFISGKGGVGKSTLAAAMALQYSKKTAKVLLIELGDQSFYKDFFHLTEIGYKPRTLKDNIDIAIWRGEDCLKEYAQYLLKVEKLTQIFFENSVMKTFLNVAPSLHELAILGKITSGIRHYGPQVSYDVIVVDAYSTGHFLALLKAPQAMSQAIQFGPMGEQTRSILQVINNPEHTFCHLVSLPEELPTAETIELYLELKQTLNIEADIILNKTFEFLIPSSIARSLDTQSIFSAYLKNHLESEKKAFFQYRKTCQKINKIPLILSHNPWTIVEKIAHHLSHLEMPI